MQSWQAPKERPLRGIKMYSPMASAKTVLAAWCILEPEIPELEAPLPSSAIGSSSVEALATTTARRSLERSPRPMKTRHAKLSSDPG